jgi:hypothetical protein
MQRLSSNGDHNFLALQLDMVYDGRLPFGLVPHGDARAGAGGPMNRYEALLMVNT